MKRLNFLWIPLVTALFLWSCGGRHGDGGGTSQTGFTSFVKDRVASTDDTAEPLEINNIDFVFTEDETAFDDILE